MFYIYILENLEGSIYVGYTANLQQRFRAHNKGKSVYTSSKRPWGLVYYEAFRSMKDARAREATLKNYGSSLGQLKRRISNSL